MRRALTALLGTVALVAVLAACGTGDDPTRTAATLEATTSPAPTETTLSPDPAGSPTADPSIGPTPLMSMAPQTAEPRGEGDLVLTDVRVGAHEGFNRLVLEFAGTGTPGWVANYVDEAVLDGSGEVVELDGVAVLDIYATGTTYPGPEQNYYSGPQRIELTGSDTLGEVYVGGTFEGYTQVLAGIDVSRVPFRVFALSDPPRLVVDVAFYNRE